MSLKSPFRLEINNPTEAEALISQNLVCQVTGIVYEVEDIRSPVLVTQCFNCQSFSHSAKNCSSKQKCRICGENHSHKGCPNKEARKPKCANCKGPHVALYKGCPEYKKQAFRQHVVNSQKTYAATVSQNTLPQPKTNKTFTFSVEQPTKFVANVVKQTAILTKKSTLSCLLRGCHELNFKLSARTIVCRSLNSSVFMC